MKITPYIMAAALLLGSCTKDNDDVPNNPNYGTMHFGEVIYLPETAQSITLINSTLYKQDIGGSTLNVTSESNVFYIPPGTVLGSGQQVTFTTDVLNFKIDTISDTLYWRYPTQNLNIATWSH